jgi:hypothetical protein
MMRRYVQLLLATVLATSAGAADLAGAKDPPGMKRYEASEIIGYRAPKFDELVLPLGRPTQLTPPVYERA